MDDDIDHENLNYLLESDFKESWESIKTFYTGLPMRTFLGEPLANLMAQFVEAIAQAGYDKRLRAGQSLHYLILSRSQDHGYLGKHYLRFSPEYDCYEVKGKCKTVQSLRVTYYAGENSLGEFEEDEIALTDRIRRLLEKLSKQPTS